MFNVFFLRCNGLEWRFEVQLHLGHLDEALRPIQVEFY